MLDIQGGSAETQGAWFALAALLRRLAAAGAGGAAAWLPLLLYAPEQDANRRPPRALARELRSRAVDALLECKDGAVAGAKAHAAGLRVVVARSSGCTICSYNPCWAIVIPQSSKDVIVLPPWPSTTSV
jgi:hypothetical protein